MISYLIRPTLADYEWRPCSSLEEAAEFVSEDDILAIYECEERDNQAPLLSDITEKAAKLWLEKHEGEIEIEDGEPVGVPDLVTKHCEDTLAEYIGEFVTSQMARERDERVLLSERL